MPGSSARHGNIVVRKAGATILTIFAHTSVASVDSTVLIQKKVQHYETKDEAIECSGEEGATSFMDVLQAANLECLPPHITTYFRAAVDPPSTSSRQHYCLVCSDPTNYTCVRCATGFSSSRCQLIHNDTRCLKFVASSTEYTCYI